MFKGNPAVHVVPPADYIEHELTHDCICGPTVEKRPHGRVYQHHSLDGREFKEKKVDG